MKPHFRTSINTLIEYARFMIMRPTVLVLGAGSSHHLGYPLGQGLIDDILNSPSEIDDPNCSDPRLIYGYLEDQIKALKDCLAMYPGGSIDAFLTLHSEFMQAGKFLIARELKKHEERGKITNQHAPGWYRILFNEIYDHETGFDQLLRIVTFNYDRSLEAYIYETLSKGFRLTKSDALSRLAQLPIEHVHGIMGDIKLTHYSQVASPNEIMKISECIQVISEVEAEGNDSFKRARQYVLDAECVYFLGFGFNDDNIKRLGFGDGSLAKGKTIRATVKNVDKVPRRNLYVKLKQYGLTQAIQLPDCDCNTFFSDHVSLSNGPLPFD